MTLENSPTSVTLLSHFPPPLPNPRDSFLHVLRYWGHTWTWNNLSFMMMAPGSTQHSQKANNWAFPTAPTSNNSDQMSVQKQSFWNAKRTGVDSRPPLLRDLWWPMHSKVNYLTSWQSASFSSALTQPAQIYQAPSAYTPIALVPSNLSLPCHSTMLPWAAGTWTY